MTSELRVQPERTSDLQADSERIWLRDEQAPAVPAVHPGRHRRAPEARSSYRAVFAIGEFRALGARKCSRSRATSSPGSRSPSWSTAERIQRSSPHWPTLTYLPPIAGGPLLSGLADLFPPPRDDRLRPVPGRHLDRRASPASTGARRSATVLPVVRLGGRHPDRLRPSPAAGSCCSAG
jgi:hypothetical protein